MKSNEQTKYKNKYRIASTRLQGYDYNQNGAYFVTICTKDRKCYFGEITKSDVETLHATSLQTTNANVSTNVHTSVENR